PSSKRSCSTRSSSHPRGRRRKPSPSALPTNSHLRRCHMRRSVAVDSSSPLSSVVTGAFRELPVIDIHESELLTNPRATFDQDALNELAASIRLHGVLQPILVRPRSNDSGYELIAGARRLRATRLAEIATIPAHVVTFDDQAAREAAIIENLQR